MPKMTFREYHSLFPSIYKELRHDTKNDISTKKIETFCLSNHDFHKRFINRLCAYIFNHPYLVGFVGLNRSNKMCNGFDTILREKFKLEPNYVH